MEKEVILDVVVAKYLNESRTVEDLHNHLESYLHGNPHVDIFIICHRDYLNQWNIIDRTYKLLSDNDIINNSWLDWIKIENKDPRFRDRGNYWYELNKMWGAATQLELKDFVGFLHPRQRFHPLLDTYDIPQLFEKYKIIMPTKVSNQGTIYNHYQHFLRISDLDLALDIMDIFYPNYHEAAEEVLSQPHFYRCNTFIMRKNDFLAWTNFQFSILFEYTKQMGFSNKEIIESHIKEHLRDFGNYRIMKKPNHFNSISYLGATVGHLSERLLNIWVHQHFKDNEIYEVPLIEGKYLNNW